MTPVSSPIGKHSRRRAIPAAIVAAALAATLAGCAQPVDPFLQTGAVADDYRVNHPITIGENIQTLDVPVSVDTQHLNDATLANVAFFAQQFQRSGTAIIAVVAPSGSPNQVAAASVAVEIEDTLRRTGVNPRAISYRVYKAGAGERIAPVRIAFNSVAATTAPCGPWQDDITKTEFNRHYENFGCATQQNLAAMVDNPLDLLYPRGMTPADAARRATVLDKYRQGQPTAADTSQEKGGSISGIGN